MQIRLVLLFLLVGFISESCTVLVNFYARNNTAAPVIIRLIKRKEFTANDFRFRSGAIKGNITYDAFENMPDEIVTIAVNDVIDITIPAQSTLYFGPDAVLRDTFEKMIIPTSKGYDTLMSEKLRNNPRLEHSKKSLTRHALWIDIE